MSAPESTIYDVITEEDEPKYKELLDSIYSGEIRLSPSSLNAFYKSPARFIQYKLKKFTPSMYMDFGTLVDLHVFTPDEVEQKVLICKHGRPSTELGTAFCDAMIGGKTALEAFELAGYKNATQKKADDAYEKYRDYIDERKNRGDRLIVTAQQNELAKKAKHRLYNKKPARRVLDQCTESQKYLQWEWAGWKFHGYSDGEGPQVIADLKMTNAVPKKFHRKALYEMFYHRQLAHYSRASGNTKTLYNIVQDAKTLEISVHRLKETTRLAACEQIEYILSRFNQCMIQNRWHEGYEFWAGKDGIYEY